VSAVICYWVALPALAQSASTEESNDIGVVQLEHASANEAAVLLERIVAAEGQSGNFIIQPDPRTNSLIIYAALDWIERATAMARQIDQPAPQSAEPTIANVPSAINFSVTLIMDGADGAGISDAEAPGSEIVSLLNDLSKEKLYEPFTDPRVVATTITRISPSNIGGTNANQLSTFSSGKFRGESFSKANACRLTVSGQLSTLDGKEYLVDGVFQVDIKQPEALSMLSANLATQATLVPNHPVLLSLTAIEGRNCLMIVELR
jgi:hypothetical protein